MISVLKERYRQQCLTFTSTPIDSFNTFEDLVTFGPKDALQKKIRENVRIFLNRPAFNIQEAEDTVLHKKSAFPLHSFTRKDKQRRTLCVHFVFPRTYWEYLSSSHHHHHRYRHWWGWGHQANTALPVYIVVFTDTFDPKVYVHLLIAVQK